MTPDAPPLTQKTIPIALGSDDAGAALKEIIKAFLEGRGYTVNDYGNGADDYPTWPTGSPKTSPNRV